MARKQLAMLGVLLGVANPGYAFDDSFDGMSRTQSVMFYYAVPLDARSRKERAPWMGMMLAGKTDYRGSAVGGFGLDSRLFNLMEESGASAASMILIGAAAVGTAAVVMPKVKSSQQQTQDQQQMAAPPSQVPCTTGCPK